MIELDISDEKFDKLSIEFDHLSNNFKNELIKFLDTLDIDSGLKNLLFVKFYSCNLHKGLEFLSEKCKDDKDLKCYILGKTKEDIEAIFSWLK